MTWAVLAALVALAGGMAAFATVAIRATSKGADDRVASAKLTAQLERMTDAHSQAVRDLGVEAAGRVGDAKRYEGVISGLKAEVTRLEGEMDESLEPTLVRDRLAGSGLLGGPETGTTAAPAAAAAANLPGLISSALGAAGRPAGGGVTGARRRSRRA